MKYQRDAYYERKGPLSTQAIQLFEELERLYERARQELDAEELHEFGMYAVDLGGVAR